MRRPSVRALICVVLVAVSTGLLASCGDIVNFGSQEAADAQRKASADLIRQLEARPGAKVTATVESSLDGGQNNVIVDARLPAAATEAQTNALGDSIERTVWLSHLDPLGDISIDITRQGSRVSVQQRLYQDEIDTRPLGVKYGPRPDGLPG
jgi:hypothetical protein